MGRFLRKQFPLNEKKRYQSMSYNRKVASLESCFSITMMRMVEDFCGDRTFLTESVSKFKSRVLNEYRLTYSNSLRAYNAEDPEWTFKYIQEKYPVARTYSNYKKFLFDVKYGKQTYISYHEA